MSSLLIISGDRSILQGKKGAFWYTLQELHAYWDRIDIITPRVKVEGATAHSASPFPNVFFHPSSKGLWYQPFWISKKGHQLAMDRQYDVMTIHDYPPFYNCMGAYLLSRHKRIPAVSEIHHIVGDPVPSSLTESIGKFLSRIFFRLESRWISAVRVVNMSVLSKLVSWGVPRKKISIIPSFYLDAAVLKPDPAIQKKFDFVFCARLVRNKGLASLLVAMSAFPSATLLVMGDGPERQRLERETRRLGLKNRVTFTGWLPDQEAVVKALQTGKIFVMPSLSEGGPRIALEAMACGMPVIATRVGVMPDVIDDGRNGVLTNGSVRDLIACMQKLLMNQHLRDEMGRQARAVLDTFDRERLVRAYSDFLRQSAAA